MNDKLENLDLINSSEIGVVADAETWSAKEALYSLDTTWYTRKSQSGRWMDIIGDYAGDELFLLEGDSLLSSVLDDRLLALGREEGQERINILKGVKH
jgi:ATP-dependent RNA helicase DDX60